MSTVGLCVGLAFLEAACLKWCSRKSPLAESVAQYACRGLHDFISYPEVTLQKLQTDRARLPIRKLFQLTNEAGYPYQLPRYLIMTRNLGMWCAMISVLKID